MNKKEKIVYKVYQTIQTAENGDVAYLFLNAFTNLEKAKNTLIQ